LCLKDAKGGEYDIYDTDDAEKPPIYASYATNDAAALPINKIFQITSLAASALNATNPSLR
jgi:hypothetical protein